MILQIEQQFGMPEESSKRLAWDNGQSSLAGGLQILAEDLLERRLAAPRTFLRSSRATRFQQYLEFGNELAKMRPGDHVFQPVRQKRVVLRNVEGV